MSLTKLGANTLTLTGSIAYTGQTTVSGGTLQLGDGTAGHDVSLAGKIVDNAALVYNLNGSQSYAGTISGNGSLTKAGTGTLTLSTSQSYSGQTVIHGGALRLVGGSPILLADPLLNTTLNTTNWTTNTSAPIYPAQVIPTINGVELVSRGYLNTLAQYNPTQVGGLNIAGNWKFTGSSGDDLIEIDTRSSGTPDGVYGEVTSGIEFWYYEGNAKPTILSRGSNFTIGTVTTTGSLNVNLGDTLSFNAIDNGLHNLSFILTDLTTSTSASATATLLSGTATNNYISFHNREDSSDISTLSNVVISRLSNGNFLPTTTPLIIAASSTLDLGGASQQVASLSDYSPGSGGSVINGNVAVASVLTLSPTSGSTTFSGMIQGGGGLGTIGLVISGSGVQVLSGANTYAGGTNISSGTLNLAHPLAVQNSTVNVSSSGALSFAAANTSPILGGLAGAGNVVLATAAAEPVTLNVGNNGQNTTYSGNLSGPGSLIKQGAGALTLTASQSYNGPTVISGGLVKLQPLPGGVSFLPVTTALTIGSSAALDLGGVSQQVVSLSDYGAGNGGSIFNSNAATASMLTLSSSGGTTTFSGLIQGGGTRRDRPGNERQRHASARRRPTPIRATRPSAAAR